MALRGAYEPVQEYVVSCSHVAIAHFCLVVAPTFVVIPEQQRADYNTFLPELWKYANDLEPKLQVCALLFKEETVKRLIDIVR